MNSIKAKMHNQVYLKLMEKGIELPELCVIDQFCEKNLYYKYLSDTKEVFKGITFQTKAESDFISVACGSIISRYAFLTYMDELNKIYGTEFPKGATNVDEFASQFVKEHGLKEMNKVCKTNFKNYLKLTNNSID